MSWTTSVSDLRNLLSDGPTDRHRYRKTVFGETNGTNHLFKTFEFRRVTDFTTAGTPLGVYKNGILLTSSAISSDYPASGEFTLVTAPADGDRIEASYYIQWFLDSELAEFLTSATNWLGFAGATSNLDPGLQPSALKYAASEAYLKMSMRWREYLSDMYRVEDMPSLEKDGKAQSFISMGETFKKEARALRDDFYTRQGQSLSPLFNSITGRVRDPMPKG